MARAGDRMTPKTSRHLKTLASKEAHNWRDHPSRNLDINPIPSINNKQQQTSLIRLSIVNINNYHISQAYQIVNQTIT